MIPSRSLSAAALAMLLGCPLYAQSSTPAAPAATTSAQAAASQNDGGTPKWVKDETPEERRARLGMPEDPGANPDPNTVFLRFGKKVHIQRYERRWAKYDPTRPVEVRPFGFANVYREIYQQNDKYVWVWEPIEDEESEDPAPASAERAVDDTKYQRYTEKEYELLASMRPDYTPLSAPAASKVIKFVESSTGLPGTGSWRNSAAVADMNGDGKLDIIAPPERTGNGLPAIFLGDGTGKWTYWDNNVWPMRIDYGSVDAADFNRDGKMDLAFGIHLRGVKVFLGDGTGKFTDASNGLPNEFATRRLRATDMNGDGAVDLVVISEGITVARGAEKGPRLRVYLNEKKASSWKLVEVAGADKAVGGDHVVVGNFNGDKQVDVAASTIFAGGNELLWVSTGALKWEPRGMMSAAINPYSVYYANTTGRFTKGKTDEVIMAYVRLWPTRIDPAIVPEPPLLTVAGVDHITFDAKGEPKRKPVARWGSHIPSLGMVTADFDADGNADFAITRQLPRREVEIYLGDGKGGFTVAAAEGVTLPSNPNYDMTVADFNGDKRPDLLLMFESNGSTRFAAKDGSIKVFLNQGTASASVAAQ